MKKLAAVALLIALAAAATAQGFAVFQVRGRIVHRYEYFEYNPATGNAIQSGCFLQFRVDDKPRLVTVLVRSVEWRPCSSMYPLNRKALASGRIELFFEVDELVYL